MSLKSNKKATKQADAKIMPFLAVSKSDNLTKMNDRITFVDIYCNTNINFLLYHYLATILTPSESKPFVPHDKSSILQKANIINKLT